MWIPVLLAFYPSIWAYDVFNQIPHFNNQRIMMYQPMFHTLLIEFLLLIGKSISSYNFRILLNSIFQMLIMSCIFSYAIEKVNVWIKNKKIRIILSFLLIIYYGLVVFNSVLSISIIKDVIFSGLLLLLIMYIYNYIDTGKLNKKCLFVFP